MDNRFTAKRLPTTRLGNFIETRVNNFLRKKEAESGEVYIRVVFSGDKTVEVKNGMKKRLVTSKCPGFLNVRHFNIFAGAQSYP